MDEDEIRLSTGRKFYANLGILGLSDQEPETLFEGYDGTVWMQGEQLPFTDEERREIAEMMIARWKRWARVP